MMRKNQKGFTLIELIIAVAILAIVTLAVCGFIVVGSKSYTSANTDIMLQQEAQLALNQISDVIIDTTDSITYSVGTGSSHSLHPVLKDSEYGGEVTDKSLVVVNRTDSASNNDNPSYWFYWREDTETLYFNELPTVSPSTDTDSEEFKNALTGAETGKAVLAEHVTDLSIDLSQFEENRVVMIAMTLKNGNREYSTSNNVTVRNRIALNVVDVDPMTRREGFSIANIHSVILEPGDRYEFTPDVTSDSGAAAVKWDFLDHPQSINTSINQIGNNCVLQVGIDEEGGNFRLKVSRDGEETYTGQNERESVTVRVTVKRVDRVDLIPHESVTKIKAGDDIVIKGTAVGRHLGESCYSLDCRLDNPSKDHDVTGWTVISGNATIDSSSSDAGSATVKIKEDAQEGDDIIIEATSVLSANKNGGYSSSADKNDMLTGIQGRIKLTVDEGGTVGAATPFPSGFQVGTDNPVPGRQVLSYLKDGMTYEADEYAVYARVKDVNGGGPDRVIIYYAGVGENIRFYPDMFGLEWNRSYELYLQAIVPVPVDVIKASTPSKVAPKGLIHQYDDDIIDQIINHPENLDSIGRYIGKKYDVGVYYGGTLNPPVVSVSIGGKVEYPNSDPNACEKYSFIVDGQTAMEKLQLGSNVNIKVNTIETKNLVKFTVYEEKGGTWTRVSGYNPTALRYEDAPSGSSKFNNVFQVQYTGNLTGDPFIKKADGGNSSDYPDVCGNYRVVVGYEYQNEAYLTERSTPYTFIYPKNFPNTGWDYSLHYYEVPDCVIPWKVSMGYNLKFVPGDTVNSNYNGVNEGTERFTIFPLPTDKDFPFKPQSGSSQSVFKKFTIYTSGGRVLMQPHELDAKFKFLNDNGATVTCEYIPGYGGSADSYKITITAESVSGNGDRKIYCYGTYKCAVGGTEWDLVDRGWEKDEPFSSNITLKKQYQNYASECNSYFPAPDNSGFPFKGTGRQSATYQMVVIQNWNAHVETANVTWDGTTLTITSEEITGHTKTTWQYGNFTYNTGTGRWVSSGGTIGSKSEPFWSAPVTITIDGNKWKIDIPGPGDDGFPTMADNKGSADFQGFYGYQPNDEYGTSGNWIAYKINYTYNPSNNTYTIVVCSPWNESAVYGTFTGSMAGGSWKVQ